MATLNSEQVIVTSGLCECHAVATNHAHHRDFPEMHAEGETCAAAARQLMNQLTRALDNVGSGYRRSAIEKALEDVKEFVVSEEAIHEQIV